MRTSFNEELPMWLRFWRMASAVPWYQSRFSMLCSAASRSTKPFRKASNRYVWAMWRCRLALLNCVST